MKHRFRGLLLVCALAAGALLGAPPENQSAGKPENQSGITVQLNTFAISWRENAPFPLTVTVSHRGPGVLSGRLELRFTDGRQHVGILRTPELAFMNTEQSYRLLVPPLRRSATWEQLSAKIRFVGEGREIPLGEQLLFIAPNATKKHLLGVCGTKVTTAETARIVLGLRLEPYMRTPDPAGLSTMPWPVPPTELSTDALHYCLYDALLFDGARLGALSDEQHRALATWVKAGGRLFVFARPVLDRRSRAFLAELERAGSEVSWPRPGPGGDANASSLRRGDLRLVRSGLGRVVIASEAPTEQDQRTTEWKQVVSFLWNLTSAEEIRILRPPRRMLRIGARRLMHRLFPGDDFSSESAERRMTTELLPDDIQMIPPVVIGVILAAFAFVVGPLDYLVLGFFRRRHLTWIVFPLTCIVFSVVTLSLSESHLGAHDVHRSMTFVDVGRGGEVLRTSEYRLFFNARNGRNTSRAEREMLTLCQNEDESHRGRVSVRFSPSGRRIVTQSRSSILSTSGRRSRYVADDLPIYEGQCPGSYGMDYRMRQWTPYLERRFRLGPGGRAPDLDWDALESLDATDVADRDRVRELLVGDRMFHGAVYVLHRGAIHTVMLPEIPSMSLQKPLFRRPTEHSNPESYHPFVGPAGGPGFDDLPLLDTESPSEFLVVVVEETEGDLTYYRRLYYGVAP